jgi:DNA-binding SARP family transcriptional activator
MVSFQVLGPVCITPGESGRTLRPQTRAILAVLIAHRNETISADYLIDAVWEGRPSRSARTQLHGHISRLRRVVACYDAEIHTQSHGYQLRCLPELVDMEVFREGAEHGKRLIEADRADEARGTIRRVLRLWHGRPFADVEVSCLDGVIEELEELRLQAVEDVAEAAISCERPADAIAQLTPLVRCWPFRERARALLMTALARAGRTADALTLYQSGRRLAVSELGLEPSEALQAVHRSVLSGLDGFRPTSQALL